MPSSSNKSLGILALKATHVKAALQRLEDGCPPHYKAATTNSLGCLLAQKTPNKGPNEGWVKTKVHGSKRKEYYAHHLALIAAKRAEDLAALAIGHQVSHLCHHRTCFNPDHLVVEEASKNRERNCCQGRTWEECPCCDHRYNPCKHVPQCLLRDE